MDRLEELREKLDEIKSRRDEDDYPGQTDEYRVQLIIEAAVEAADDLILEGTDGSVEETDYLTSAVAIKFAEKAHCSLSHRLLMRIVGAQTRGAAAPGDSPS